jgi:hypothetical protein
MMDRTVDPEGRWLYRVGGICALVLGLAYIVIFPLFARVGAPPTGGAAWLQYLDGKTTVWWAILGIVSAAGFFITMILNAVFVTLWVLSVGGRLCRLGWRKDSESPPAV